MGLINILDKTAYWFVRGASKKVNNAVKLGTNTGKGVIRDLKNPIIKNIQQSIKPNSKISRTLNSVEGRYRKFRLGRIKSKLKKTQANATSSLSNRVKWGRRIGTYGGVMVGTVGMIGIGVMKGMMNQASDYNSDRYAQNYNYTKNLLANSRLARTMGSPMIDHGSTMGLSNSLSRTRHGY